MLNKKSGFALFFTVILVSLIVLAITTFLLIATNDLRTVNKIANSTCAYYLADAGISDAFMVIRNSPSLTGPGTFDLPSSGSTSYSIGPGRTGIYQVHVQYGASPVYTITSTGIYKGTTKKLQLCINSASFSRWAYATNVEYIPAGVYPWYSGGLNPGIIESYWVTGNLVVGPFNTNEKLYIAGNPVFNGPVSQVYPAVKYYDGGPPLDNPNFVQGLTLNAPAVTMPTPSTRNNIYNAAGANAIAGVGDLLLDGTDPNIDPVTHSINSSTTIILYNNGTMDVTNYARGWGVTKAGIYTPPQNVAITSTNGAIFVYNGNVKVQGTLNGQLTIGCDNNIYTPGSIIYHDTSPGNPNLASTDMLGLVAQQNVIIPNSAPNDIEIDGYIVALTGSFYLENCWTCPLKGYLVQFGGVMTGWSATVFGCFSGAGIVVRGYTQEQFYDARLLDAVPKWFTLAQDLSSPGRMTYSKASFHEVQP